MPSMISLFTYAFWVLAALCVLTTILPFVPSYQWWIRGWDFPRVQIAVMCIGVLAIALIFQMSGWGLITVAMLACISYQTYRIAPYTPFVTKEVELVADTDTSFTALSVNVLMENTDHAPLIDMIEDQKPDIILLMETDQTWADAVLPSLQDYPTVISKPQGNHYGMIFATKLETNFARFEFLSDENTPAAYAEMLAPNGRKFRFVGLHPKPPVPGQSAKARDQEIQKTARLAHNTNTPIITMGDFNDVAWSGNSEKFKDYGEFLDPRIGRGMIPSFNTKSWIMRFPIDQLYFTDNVGLVDFSRGKDIGSDHYPMKATFVID